ncbi:hypothetical protein AAG570_008959 [Ranatra chinensis]|uniref:Uncharacterized protein n=1 Tax=Ranatra chinensis TaxID=642074 RepID=A0ABD0Z322_9HEMI
METSNKQPLVSWSPFRIQSMNKDLKMKRKSGDGRLKKWLYKIRPIRVTGDKTEDPQVAHRWRRFVDKAQTIALQDPSQRYENVLDIVGEEVYNRVSPMLGLPELEDIYPERFFKAALRPKTIVAPTHPLHRRPVAVEKSLRSLASTYPV